VKPYLDTNFLLRAFLDYEDSESALHRLYSLRRNRISCPATWLHRIEYANALHLLVFQSRSGGKPHVTPQIAAVAQLDFDTALQPDGELRDASLSTPELVELCDGVSSRHTAKHGFRTYDTIHVSSALLLKCDRFWSFDAKTNKLAALEGLKTL
jgi:predicted nucleic acid-binding protein